jgi:enoyl-CoA hydratase/carnithine racemase
MIGVEDAVLTVTINRPDVMNSFNEKMCMEFQHLWTQCRDEASIHSIVLRAAGDRAFSTGVDRKEGIEHSANPWHFSDPGPKLGPKSNGCFKPIICAVNGMCAGGAMYWLNESDIVICSDDATFFDPHVTYGMISALEPLGMLRRVPMGEVLRWALMGLDERMSAQRALTIGLVSEVVPRAELHTRADAIARKVASKPSVATEGTVKAIWEAGELSPQLAQRLGVLFAHYGNPFARPEVEGLFESGVRPEWEVR